MPSLWKASFGAVLALAIYAAPAHAQLLTFVSATGADSRPCTVQAQPCRTLQRANDATTAGGEIRLLSSLPNQIATIDKSLTVDGDGHTMIGAIVVNSGTAVVTLRDLSLNGRNTNATGIDVVDAAVVHIERCTVERYTATGIQLRDSLSTELFISDSVSGENGIHGLQVLAPTNAKTSIDNSRFENNAQRGLRIQGGAAAVTNSIASGNGLTGMTVDGGTTNFTGSTAVNNGSNGFSILGGQATLESSVAHGNVDDGVFVGALFTVRISGSVITNNGLAGVNVGGTAFSLGDNLIAGNSSGDVSGALTPLAAQ